MFKKFRQRLDRGSQRQFHLIQIEASMHCNLECVMCPWIDKHTHEKILSPGTFANIKPYLPRTKEVDLTGGGEPLTNPYLTDMVRAAKEAGCEVGFSTNGTLLNQTLAETFVSLELDWISFSFDAAKPETYHQIRQGSSYDTVVKNIEYLSVIKDQLGSQKPKVMLVFVMMMGNPQNFQELPEYITLAHSLGIEQVIVKNLDVIIKDGDYERGVFSHDGMPMPEIEAVREQAQKRAANLGIGLRLYNLQPHQQVICEQRPDRNLFVNWVGNVSPCITLSYAGSRVFNGERVSVPCQVFGNVNNQPLDAVWSSPDYTTFRAMYQERLRQERGAMMQAMLGGDSDISLPPAPKGCQTCYYLYGI